MGSILMEVGWNHPSLKHPRSRKRQLHVHLANVECYLNLAANNPKRVAYQNRARNRQCGPGRDVGRPKLRTATLAEIVLDGFENRRKIDSQAMIMDAQSEAEPRPPCFTDHWYLGSIF